MGRPVLFATTDEFLKRFKLGSLEDLPDYDALMAAITRTDDRDSYLYAREEYSDVEKAESAAEPKERRSVAEEGLSEGGYEIPDFLRGLDDTDLVKIS